MGEKYDKSNLRNISFFSRVYWDGLTRGLDEKYDVLSCPCSCVEESGSLRHQVDSYRILLISKINNRFVGLKLSELENFLCSTDWDSSEYFRVESMGDFKIVFPTERLLENQKVQKK